MASAGVVEVEGLEGMVRWCVVVGDGDECVVGGVFGSCSCGGGGGGLM